MEHCRISGLRLHLMILLSIILSGCVSNSTTQVNSSYDTFTDAEWGISFEYPATMVQKLKSDSREENGYTLTSNTVEFTDRKEATIILIQMVDDPYLASDPTWYPPKKTQLQIFAAGDIGSLAIEKTQENNKAVNASIENAMMTEISEFPSIEYKTFLNDPKFGEVYIHGAVVVTPKRSYTIMVFGGLSNEGAIHSTATSERVDEIWDRLTKSIIIKK